MSHVRIKDALARMRSIRWMDSLWDGSSTRIGEDARKEEVLSVFRELARESRNQEPVREYVPFERRRSSWGFASTEREPPRTSRGVTQHERLLPGGPPSAPAGQGMPINDHLVSDPDDYSRSVKDTVSTPDDHGCRRCGTTENLEVDHIKPIRLGGERTLDNRQMLCRECHRLKTRYEGWIRTKPASRLLGPHLPQATGSSCYYVVPGVWNATKGRWEQYGPFSSYGEAWEWVESRWLTLPGASKL